MDHSNIAASNISYTHYISIYSQDNMSQQLLSKFFKVQKKEEPPQNVPNQALTERKENPTVIDLMGSPKKAVNEADFEVVTETMEQISGNSHLKPDNKENTNGRKRSFKQTRAESTSFTHKQPSDKTTRTSNSVKRSKGSEERKLTPLEQQFVDFKINHLDKILAIQVGYKYKFFGSDALTASKILNIMLIPGRISLHSQDCTSEETLYDKFAYCSIPDNRLHIHLKRLLHRGLKVGVISQNEPDDTKSSKVFEREFSGVYTSSTYIEDLDEDLGRRGSGGNFIVCLREINNLISMVAVNVYSAEVAYDEFADDFTRNQLNTRLDHLDPLEFLVIGEVSKETLACITNYNNSHRDDSAQSRIEKREAKNVESCLSLISNLFTEKVLLLVTELSPNLQNCFVELALYLDEFNLRSIFQVADKFDHFSETSTGMVLQSDTLRSLEIFKNSTDSSEKGSLIWLLDHTNTRFGYRLLKKWIGRPLTDREDIMKRVDAIGSVMNNSGSILVERILKILRNCPDLELSLSRIHYSRSKRKEIYLFLKKLEEIFTIVLTFKDELVNHSIESIFVRDIFFALREIVEGDLKDFRTLLQMIYIPAAMDDTSETHISAYFNKCFFGYADIEAQMDAIEETESEINDQLPSIRKIIKRPNSNYTTNNKEPYLIDVRNTEVKNIPQSWIKINGTKSVSRFRTPEVVELYKRIVSQKKRLNTVCELQFQKFVERLDSHYVHVNKLINNLAILDCILSLSVASMMNENYSKPTFVDEQLIHLNDSFNPIVQSLKVDYIPNSFEMTKTQGRVTTITGPNMGGKSSFTRQIALTVIMAQVGCFIPASAGSKLGIFDSLYIRMGAQDNIMKRQSTFQVELLECNSILQQCTSRSLVLLDEIGRGTGTKDGYAIAYSILDYLTFTSDAKPFVLFITHFRRLLNFAKKSTTGLIKNYYMGFKETDDEGQGIVFTYKLMPGGCDRSYGVNCAKLSGLPNEITGPALEVSRKYEEQCEVNGFWGLLSAYEKFAVKEHDFERLWTLIDDLD